MGLRLRHGGDRASQRGGTRGLERRALRPLRRVPGRDRRRARRPWRVGSAPAPPSPGDRVIDIGCGFGDTAQAIASMVGPDGSVKGVDVAERFIETARGEAQEAGTENVSFDVVDVEIAEFEQEYDYAFSRFGTMFFANPGAAMRRILGALRPGGRLCMVVWRRKLDNDWLHRAETRRQGVRRRARGERRADLWPRSLLDGQRRHRLRHPRSEPGSRTSPSLAATSSSASAATSTAVSR